MIGDNPRSMRGTVINMFGGPGVGKSTYAAHTYAQMKIRGLSVALVNEVAQEMIFEGRFNVLEKDQLLIFSEQNRKVLRVIDKFDYIITDSPIILSNIYFNDEKCIYEKHPFEEFVLSTFNQYKNINIYLTRATDWFHNMEERIHEKEDAKVYDHRILQYLLEKNIPFKEVANSIAKSDIGEIIPMAA